MFIRTKRKGSAFQGDLHHFDNKWTEVPDGEVRAFYLDNDNLEVVEDPKHAKETKVTGEPEAEPETKT